MEYRGRGVSEVAVIGRACRLPGASDVDGLWSLLGQQRSAIRKIPEDRWSLSRFGHPRRGEPGRSYTWAAGVLDDIWGFDAAAFGISPREAEQMDPQQRLLLELVREALDDGGVPASSLSGKDIGVYVGASSLDHGNSKLFDVAASDAYFATGNALSLIANRISYVYDLHGPSMTIDTACSSSLVALHQATSAIRSGQIKTAIVAGVNILASPFSFIGFSRAAMLSPTGLCHSFSDDADGYVRAEGGVVLVLRALPEALAARNDIHGLVLATGTNSDGRTTGVAFPSFAAQSNLLTRVYGDNHIDPNDLAFVEAHGTGTKVGDPAEARAMGEALGRKRERALPIGSIKSNIGHLEPASGLAGVLKSMLALKHNLLPASLHCDVPNRDIPFDALNLAINTKPRALTHDRDSLAGISSFGFGGTNAHAVIGRAPIQLPHNDVGGSPREQDQIVLLSAHSDAALADFAESFAEDIVHADAIDVQRKVAALAHRRDRAPVRAAILASDPDEIIAGLADIADADADERPNVVMGRAVEADAKTAFVYSGNGSQWAGMGRAAFEHNATFRDAFRKIDALFAPLSGWALEEMLFSDDLEQQLPLTSIAQPLIFAIQSAATEALASLGLHADMVLGHSVGEIAAAHASGRLPTASAVRVIHARSKHQELARLKGRMAVVFATEDATRDLLRDHPDVDIAALNSAGAFTIAGPEAALMRTIEAAKVVGIKTHVLDLDYPFHCAAMDVVRDPLLADLQKIEQSAEAIPFISTVDPARSDTALDADYWWRNVREPVQFTGGLQRAADLGARIFIEIGPRTTLMRHIVDTFAQSGTRVAALGSLERSDADDPFRRIFANALVRGARISSDNIAGANPGPGIRLPAYPWQRKTFRLSPTGESLAVLNPAREHPLIGSRLAPDATEWFNDLDTLRMPDLADHVVGEHAILPGAAFLEMIWAASMEWRGADRAMVTDVEIVQPLVLTSDASVQVRTKISPDTGIIEIASRPRLSSAAWTLHAKGKSIEPIGLGQIARFQKSEPETVFTAEQIYRKAANLGLHYGPSFQQVSRTVRYTEKTLTIELVPCAAPVAFGISPAQLDACYHGVVSLLAKGERSNDTFIPVKFGDSRLEKPGCAITHADVFVAISDDRKVIADFTLFGATGEVIAVQRGARFQVRPDDTRAPLQQQWIATQMPVPHVGATSSPCADVSFDDILDGVDITSVDDADAPNSGADSLLREGWAMSLAMQIATRMATDNAINIERLIVDGRLAAGAGSWLRRLLDGLIACGLAERTDDGYRLLPDASLPDASDVLRAIAAEFPHHSAELLGAAQVAQMAALPNETNCFADLATLAIEALNEYGIDTRRAAAIATRIAASSLATTSADHPLRILLLGGGTAFSALRRSLTPGATLALLDADARRLQKARLSCDQTAKLTFATSLDELKDKRFDLVLSANSIGCIAETQHSLLPLQALLAPGGLLALVEPLPSLFSDLVGGLSEPRGGTAAHWQRMLSTLPEQRIARVMSDDGEMRLLLARASGEYEPAKSSRSVIVIATDPESPLAQSIARQLAERGCHTIVSGMDDDAALQPCDEIVFIDRTEHKSDSSDTVAARILALKTLIMWRHAVAGRISVVTFGAFAHDDAKLTRTESAVTSFLRTAANEYPKVSFRQFDLAPDRAAEDDARLIADTLLADSAETELVLDETRTRAIRIAPLQKKSEHAFAQQRLLREHGAGGLDRLRWTPVESTPLEADQIAIAVKATGVNFRDLMSAMSLLPDTILEHGYAGPTMGLECAGVVTHVGSDVKDFAVGDRVIAMSRHGFATEVVVPSSGARLLPQHIPFEAGASIPVAFATAYYSLVTLAHIGEGDTVLIHGGAGGVGLAALQIAKSRGATVIASAGSNAKRDLLLSLGADHVVNSRALSFTDEVRAISPDGVHVVLNSVAGEAMERSLGLLRPFGHFVELGKRDYVANTHIGLMPFGRNLNYHGVDLDQLVIHRPAIFASVLDAVIDELNDGTLTPIPYRVFAVSDATEAFRVMQKSSHIGKLVITPPRIDAPIAHQRHAFDSSGTHLVTGGLGGFGLKTASWLVTQGVRSLVLVGRRAPSDAAAATINEMEAQGAKVHVASCDVSDEHALRMLLDRIRAEMPPLRGVYHAAMVLHDGTIANLAEHDLRATLAPKVDGALALDKLTRGDALSHFVMFSSATTFFGNPGQSAYVAANACLESLARTRCSEGLPALAVAWGAIGDVGVLADNESLRKSLLDRVGIQSLSSQDALDALADVLASDSGSIDEAVVAIAPINWSAARGRLNVLRSPTYALVAAGDQSMDGDEDNTIDLRAVLAQSGRDAAIEMTRNVVTDVISRVLRLPSDEIDTQRPLAEMGIDSLVSIELAMQIEARLGEKLQLTASVGALSLSRLAIQIVEQLGTPQHDLKASNTAAALLARHMPAELIPNAKGATSATITIATAEAAE